MAISKERLEELIKKSATIFCPYYMYYDGVELDKNTDYIDKEYLYIFRQIWKKESTHDKFKLKDLFETEEDAKFALEFQDIERVEKLSLPTWSELKEFDSYKKIKFMGKNGEDYGFCIGNGKYDKAMPAWCGIDIDGNCEIYHFEPLTKENYLKACSICKKLFLGEVK